MRQDNQRKTDQFVEASQAINGPAGNPECVWLGRRMVRLMWNDDLDTAFRHLDLYDRFGCPGATSRRPFRCLTRLAREIDSKVPESLDRRVHACWINPNAQPQAAAVAQPVPPSTAGAATAAPASTASPTPAAAPPNNPNRCGTIKIFAVEYFAPSKRHGVITVVKWRGRDMLD